MGDKPYLANVAISNFFPHLFDNVVKVPKYFLHDFQHRTRDETLSNLTYITPSLFIGPGGSFTSLHIDQWCSNFWMCMIEGEKHWITFHPEDRLCDYLKGEWSDEGQIIRYPKSLQELDWT